MNIVMYNFKVFPSPTLECVVSVFGILFSDLSSEHSYKMSRILLWQVNYCHAVALICMVIHCLN